MKKVFWKVEGCPQCSHIAVKSMDDFWGCLKCKRLDRDEVSLYLQGRCVHCGQALIPLMEACLTCGNQPRYLWERPSPVLSFSSRV